MTTPLRRGIWLAAFTLFAASAGAQLTPDRAYYGIGRVIQMKVTTPPNMKAGEAVVKLLAPVSGEAKGAASVVPGYIDLAGLFPQLWDINAPRTAKDVLYAQLFVGEQKIGAPVVLQPLVDPDYCVYIDTQTGEPQFRPTRGIFSGMRAYVDQHVVMETSMGDIEFALRPDQAPNTAWNFLDLARSGFYTDISIHRIVALNENTHAPFVIQAGDPNYGHAASGVGEGGPGYAINLERSSLPHDFGVLSMARSSKVPNSGGSQFFICLSREGTSHLDGQFTTFGQAVAGAETIQKIAAAPVNEKAQPREAVVIKQCRVVPAPPFGEGPKPLQSPSAAPVTR